MPHDRLLGPYPADGMTFASIFPPLPLAAIQPAAPGASRCARATMRWQDRVPGRAKARAISNPTDDPFDGRQPTSHERMTGLPWDASYHHGPAPWHRPTAVSDSAFGIRMRVRPAGARCGSASESRGRGTSEGSDVAVTVGCQVRGPTCYKRPSRSTYMWGRRCFN